MHRGSTSDMTLEIMKETKSRREKSKKPMSIAGPIWKIVNGIRFYSSISFLVLLLSVIASVL